MSAKTRTCSYTKASPKHTYGARIKLKNVRFVLQTAEKVIALIYSFLKLAVLLLLNRNRLD
jgi:hypothetical protein